MIHRQSVLDILSAANVCAVSIEPVGLDGISSAAGAYVLLIETTGPVPVRLPRYDALTLAPGTYLYVGSANGPGGMKARLKRHFKRSKKIHWHVDQLTTHAVSVEALAVAGGNECTLGQILTASNRFRTALAGFGSSDCRSCKSHLLVPV